MKDRGGCGDFERERQFQIGALVDQLDRKLAVGLCNFGVALRGRCRMRRRRIG